MADGSESIATKTCNRCTVPKPATSQFFSPKKTCRGGLYTVCKVCDALRAVKYRAENPPKYTPLRAASQRRWRANRRERAREIQRESQKRRRKDGRYRASASVSVRIWKSLKGKGGTSWQTIVGYTRAELSIHLERQFYGCMTWSNFGSVWHIDHIRPVSSFKFSGYEDREFRDCWALTNLRPLLKRENLIKRDHRTHLI